MSLVVVHHHPEDEQPMPELVIPELAYVLACARSLAWSSHCNVIGLRYAERREAHARLRGALDVYDRARGAVAQERAALGGRA